MTKYLLSGSRKYRCCFGCIHVETFTKILCYLFILNNINDAKNYYIKYKHDDWELFKIVYGLISTIGPLIGIEKKKPAYFIPCLLAPVNF